MDQRQPNTVSCARLTVTSAVQCESLEIGNEIWGNWVRGHSDADTYARIQPLRRRHAAKLIPRLG